MRFVSFVAVVSLALLGCQKKDAASGAKSESGAAAASEAIPATPPVAGEIVMTAELADIPGAFPANDIYNYAYIMKYKVIKVLQGTYTDPDILVGHYNPRVARADIHDDQDSLVGGNVKYFKVGEKHYLVLSKLDGLWNGAKEDEYFKDSRPRYWARWADKL